jgi:hypothetical protein
LWQIRHLKRPIELNQRQQRHAEMMMREVPALANLRYRLCPLKMDDDVFWWIYFCLIRNRLPRVLVRCGEHAHRERLTTSGGRQYRD